MRDYYRSTITGSTPNLIQKLIILTACTSLLTGLLDGLISYTFNSTGPQQWLSLNWWGMSQAFIWQPLTYLLVSPLGPEGISFSFLISLSFNMYILWLLGGQLAERMGTKRFLLFYSIIGVLAGLTALLFMPVIGRYTSLAGPTPAIFAVVMLWTLLYSESQIFLFGILPVKAKWIGFGLIGLSLMIDLSQLNTINFILNFSAPTYAYLYGLTVYGIHSPFIRLYRFELFVIRMSERIKRLFKNIFKIFSNKFSINKSQKKEDSHSNSNIFDIKTGEPLEDNDDVFIDKMLEKIAKNGISALSWWEKRRMDSIARERDQKDSAQTDNDLDSQ